MLEERVARIARGKGIRPEASGETVVAYEWDLITDVVVWGDNFAQSIAIADESFGTGFGYAEHLSSDSVSSRYEAVMQPGAWDTGEGVPFQVVYGLVVDPRSDEAPVWVEDTGRWFAGGRDRVGRVTGAIRVITAQHEAERARLHQTQRDPLTGALNAETFSQHLGHLLALTGGRRQRTFAVCMADVVAIPEINAVADDAVRDEVLAAIARRLRHAMRAHEALGFDAGRRFLVVLQDCDAGQMTTVARRLIAVIEGEPVTTSRGSVRVTARIGGLVAPTQARTVPDILSAVAQALDASGGPEASGFAVYGGLRSVS